MSSPTTPVTGARMSVYVKIGAGVHVPTTNTTT